MATLRRTADQRGRTYWWKDRQYPSVTSIISGGLPKPELAKWAAQRVAAYASEHLDELRERRAAGPIIDKLASVPWAERDAAADLGSEIHAHAEARSLGQTLPLPSILATQYLAGLDTWISRKRPLWAAAEATVVNTSLGYAGTLDAIVELDGQLTMVDYKTGRSVWPDAALQLAAYAHAEWLILPSGEAVPMPVVTRAGVLHLQPLQARWIEADIGPTTWQAFLAVWEVWRWRTEWSAQALGEEEATP